MSELVSENGEKINFVFRRTPFGRNELSIVFAKFRIIRRRLIDEPAVPSGVLVDGNAIIGCGGQGPTGEISDLYVHAAQSVKLIFLKAEQRKPMDGLANQRL